MDNNRSRQLCHKVFYAAKDLVYIDSGNGKNTGQVVCGIRSGGRTFYRPVGKVYPDVLTDKDKFPTELSCAEASVSAPQSITANVTGNGNGASAVSGTGSGNGASAENGTGNGNGASAESGTGSGNGASAVSGTGSGNGANVEDSVAAAGGSATNGQQLAGQTAVSRETSVQSERVEMLFAEMTDAVYVKNEGLYDRNGELLVSEENLTYDPQKGLYVGDTLAYTKDTSAESDDTIIAMVSLAKQQEAVLNGLGDMLVLYDPYTGAYSTRATAELLENGGRSNTEAENGIAEMAEEMEDSGFSIGSAFGRSLTDREESGFAWIAVFAAAGVLILVALYFRVRKRRE